MAIKISSNQSPVPSPIIFGIGCGMYTYKTTTSLDVTLKGRFLVIIQHILGGTQKDYGRIFFKTVVCKKFSVFCRIYFKPVFSGQLNDSRLSGRDRAVPETGGLAENQYPGLPPAGIAFDNNKGE